MPLSDGGARGLFLLVAAMGRRGFLGMLAALVVAPATAAQAPGALVQFHGREAILTADEWRDLSGNGGDLRTGDSLSLAS